MNALDCHLVVVVVAVAAMQLWQRLLVAVHPQVCAFHLAGTMMAAWIEAKVLQSFDDGCFTSFNTS